MELIRGIHNINRPHHGCVLTIGNFDGVHLGHHQVIARAVNKARALNLPSVLMVFEPQPQELFAGFTNKPAPARLTRLRDKHQQLAKLGVDRLLCVNFNRRFSSMPAVDFVESLLVEKLGVKHLIVGDDFRFGYKRQGDFEMLVAEGKKCGFSVESTQSFRKLDCRVSSTAIRHALAEDDLVSAKALLGRDYSITGRVAHGDKKGRTIGFPTANIFLKRRVSPVSGVYVVKTQIQGQAIFGVANIGQRPTVAGTRQQLEVHLFDFDQDIYGQQLEVFLLHKLREEQKFASFTLLQQQIDSDVGQAKHWLDNECDK